jgi:hypothetical protein
MLDQNRHVYPEPFFPAAEQAAMQDEIRRRGFAADPVLAAADAPVFGVNVAFAWPLPAAFRAAYDELHDRLAALDPGLYVYPHAQTHVTVATVVNFKEYSAPTTHETARLRALVPAISRSLDRACAGVAPFTIEMGAPVLVRAAAFLPILNPGGEVGRIREVLADELRNADAARAGLKLPNAVHSTVLRFRQVPADPKAFVERFLEIAKGVSFGTATIDELLVTTETKPYMRNGEIVHRQSLREAP